MQHEWEQFRESLNLLLWRAGIAAATSHWSQSVPEAVGQSRRAAIVEPAAAGRLQRAGVDHRVEPGVNLQRMAARHPGDLNGIGVDAEQQADLRRVG
jgi:hypothetical protein